MSNVPVWVDIILMQDRLRIAAKWDGGGGEKKKEPWPFTGGLTVFLLTITFLCPFLTKI